MLFFFHNFSTQMTQVFEILSCARRGVTQGARSSTAIASPNCLGTFQFPVSAPQWLTELNRIVMSLCERFFWGWMGIFFAAVRESFLFIFCRQEYLFEIVGWGWASFLLQWAKVFFFFCNGRKFGFFWRGIFLK